MLSIDKQIALDRNITMTAESVTNEEYSVRARVKICGGEQIKKSQE